MGKVAKADASVNEARFYHTLHSPPSVFYVTFSFAVPTSTLTALDANGATNGPRAFELVSNFDGLFLRDPFLPTSDYWTIDTPNGPFSGFTPDTWHTIEYGYNAHAVTWKLDGSAFDSFTEPSSPPSTLLAQFGAFSTLHHSGYVYYIDDVKIGTTPGGTDIFADGFESGDLSAWETVIGDVTVVDDPGFAGGGGGGVSGLHATVHVQ